MLRIVPVKAFKDNYVWTLRNATHAAVVDPGEARPVLDYLSRERLELAAILATHHHADHVGGIAELVAMRAVPVYGPRKEPIPTLTRPVSEGDGVRIPELGVDFSVIDIPGHTRAHIAYYGAGSLFCGDTLFACGCGRLFEGTAEQMYASLQKLRALPDETKVYCGHEYTLANIGFAKTVEPGNAALKQREARDQRLRAAGPPGAAPSAGPAPRQAAARAAAGHSSRRVRPVALRGRAAGRAGAAARLEEDRSHRAAGGPLAAHSPGLRDPRPRQRPGGEAHRVLRRAPRIPAARLRPQPAVSLSHRRGDRKARAADRAGAAADGGERVQPDGLLARARLGTVAVHPGHRQALRAEAELVVRRAPRHRRLDHRGPRLPPQALRPAWLLAAPARLL